MDAEVRSLIRKMAHANVTYVKRVEMWSWVFGLAARP